MLEWTNIRHVTDRRGVETLVVTKPSAPSLAKHEQWRKRFSNAQEQINTLDQEILKQLLGDEYEYITKLRDSKRDNKGLPVARVTERRQGPEIIDLTLDRKNEDTPPGLQARVSRALRNP
ncbi:MAG: hypothetical protein ASARMPREDX12_007651 [Alectoria sarmentosa]|nr:MAG: hypothetical protein ASARMPREDX12_007651 [Alectoria sarmentosa]